MTAEQDEISPFLVKVYKTNIMGKSGSLSDKDIAESPFSCIYVWKSTTLREVMSLLAVEDPDAIPRSVSMSVKSVFVRPSSGKLAYKDLGIVFNFKVSKDEHKTLEELGFNVGDFLWINTMKGAPQKSIIGSAKALPRAEVLNKTIQSRDFGIDHRSRVTPYDRLGNERREFRSRAFRGHQSRHTDNDRRHKDRMDQDTKKDHKTHDDKYRDQKTHESHGKGDDGW